VAYVGVVDSHHHVLKSTTSAGAVRDVRDMRERRDPKFKVLGSQFRKPRTSDLRSARLSRQSRSAILVVRAGPNCLWVWR